MTANGYVAGINGEIDWMTFNWDSELSKQVKEITKPVDCIVLDRKLAQGFIPHRASNPESEDALGIAKINDTTIVVFTKSLDKSDWENTVLVKGDIVEEITKLKNQNGKDILAYDRAIVVSALIRQGLIDEFHLLINPTAICNGMTIFKDLVHKQNLT